MAEDDADETQILGSLGEQIKIHPFEITNRSVVSRWGRGSSEPDGLLTLRWGRQVQRFVVVYKSSSSPKQIEQAAQAARRYAQRDPSLAPMVVAPYLQPEVLKRLVDDCVSGIDRSGNYAIVVPDQWLVVKSGARNRFPAQTPIKNVYRGRSGLVARALFLHRSFPSATDLAEQLRVEGPVSFGTISKVLSAMENDLLVDRSEGEIRLLQAEILLDRLRDEHRPPHVRKRLAGSVSEGLYAALVPHLNNRERDAAVRYSADIVERYVILPQAEPVTRIYVEAIGPLLRDLPIDTSSRFPTVELLEVADPGIYYDRRPGEAGLLKTTSPLQVYLELMAGGKREQQAAQPLRQDLLAGRYGR